jgi:uncharacterized membrane protein YgcG
MTSRTLFLSLLLVSTAPLLGAQTLARDKEQALARPLNLSVRKQTAPVVDPALILLEKDALVKSQAQADSASPVKDDSTAVALPYGSGYESRQQVSTSSNSSGTNGGRGAGGSAGGSGAGGSGGRGGAGRGR